MCVLYGATYITIHYVHKLYVTRDCSLLTYTLKQPHFSFLQFEVAVYLDLSIHED